MSSNDPITKAQTTPSTKVSPGHGVALAVLDDYLGSSRVHFDALAQTLSLEQVTYFPDTIDVTSQAGLHKAINRLQPYHVISSMRERTQFPKELLQALPNLKLLMNSSARNRSIDIAVAEQQGIVVTGTKGKYVRHVPPPDFDNTTQHAWSLILALTSRTYEDCTLLRNEISLWQQGHMVSLAGKTLGVVGLGKLGGRTARTAIFGFGMKVIAWSENLTQEKADSLAKGFGLNEGQFRVVSKDELFRTSDIISLHLVFSERTKNIVGETELDSMKQSAFLINTARAGILDEDALWKALTSGRIAGAALDVWWTEPLPPESRWRNADAFGKNGQGRLIMSPHMGYVEQDTMSSWYQEQGEILDAWIQGKSLNEYKMNSN